MHRANFIIEAIVDDGKEATHPCDDDNYAH
jgi:hypothetical protein